MDLNLIGQIKKLEIKNGDIIAVKVNQVVSLENANSIKRAFEIALEKAGLSSDKVSVLIIEKGISVEALDVCNSCKSKLKGMA